MNKEDIIKKIKEDTGCDEHEAESIFERALDDGIVKRHLNWNFIITMLIYLSVLMTGAWALWRHL
jgi:hypothetical protein|tara:strand:+ start:67 stop:261 length:195 start_codon:yes stop_codon:yes gene_type:complete